MEHTAAAAPTFRLRHGRPGAGQGVVLALTVALFAGCASTPSPAPGRHTTDGPPAHVPIDLDRVPSAQPRLEPQRVGGPNKPYRIDGQLYVPFVDDRALVEHGLASWYGRKYHGRPTSMGEPYDMFAMTAAHPTMPLPSYARVTNPANRRSVVVRINDRGPFVAGRVIDLSYAAAHRLDLLRGVAPVVVERLTREAIRAEALLAGGEFSARR